MKTVTLEQVPKLRCSTHTPTYEFILHRKKSLKHDDFETFNVYILHITIITAEFQLPE